MKIGFIGLGIMGKPMAKNLIKAGYDLIVYDLNPAAVAEVASCGAQAAGCIAEVAAVADRLITMVPNSPQVKEVLLGEGGAIKHLRKGSIVIDCSSINPVASREVEAALPKRASKCLMLPSPAASPRLLTARWHSW